MTSAPVYVPKLLTTLQGYDRRHFVADLTAGAIVHLIRRTRVLLSDVHAQPLVALSRSVLLEELGEDNLYGDVDAALEAARAWLGVPPAGPGRERTAPPSTAPPGVP